MITAPLPVEAPLDMARSPYARRRTTLVWGLLFISSLPWSGGGRIVFIPKRVEQLFIALCLAAAVAISLLLNRRLRVRPTSSLLAYFLLPVVALIPVIGGRTGLGSLFRTSRFALALLCVLLTSPVWRTDPRLLLRTHLKVILLSLGSVVLTLLAGQGFDREGRLWGVEPAFTAPAVGQYAAILAGVAVLLVLTKSIRTPRGLRWIALGLGALLMSQTRTAMVGLVVGLFFAVLSLVSTSARSRKVVVVVLLSLPLAVAVLGPLAISWFQRGQDQSQIATLTGRTKAWKQLYDFPRDGYTRVFGTGLSDKSINGLPIDSGYLAVFHEEGQAGLVVIGLIFALLLIQIMLRPPGVARAIALFLLLYCAVASYAETGIGDMSSYVLHLLLAGSLVAPTRRTSQRSLPVFSL